MAGKKPQCGGKIGAAGAGGVPAFGGLQGLLPYRTDAIIMQPAIVTLEEGFLVWTVDSPSMRDLPEEYSEEAADAFSEALDRPFSPRPVEGCLEDFLSLSPSATPEDVLAFACRRGPLGIAPFVTLLEAECEGCQPGDPGTRVRYMEPVFAYTEMALGAKVLVESVKELREGLPLDFAAAFQQVFPESKGSPRQHLYSMITKTGERWAQAATTKLGVVLQAPNVHPSVIGDSFFRLDFGHWFHGLAWDGRHEQSADQITATLSQIAKKPWKGWLAADFSGQRPSALFNVLAFQLLAAVTLPAGLYICEERAGPECVGAFRRDYEEGRRRPKRSDIPCCDKCRPVRDRRLDTERKRRAAEAKRLAEL